MKTIFLFAALAVILTVAFILVLRKLLLRKRELRDVLTTMYTTEIDDPNDGGTEL